jgi:hypothetical protein
VKAEFLIERPTASGETVTSNAQKFAVYRTDDEEPLKWSGSTPLPQIGDETRVTMNNIGPATVVGFFKEEGFVGVMVRLQDPPAWLVRQLKTEKTKEAFKSRPGWYKDGVRCYFGAEIAAPIKACSSIS